MCVRWACTSTWAFQSLIFNVLLSTTKNTKIKHPYLNIKWDSSVSDLSLLVQYTLQKKQESLLTCNWHVHDVIKLVDRQFIMRVGPINLYLSCSNEFFLNQSVHVLFFRYIKSKDKTQAEENQSQINVDTIIYSFV